MATAITDGITSAISAVGNVVTAIFGATGGWKDLLPAIGLSIGFAVCFMGVRLIKSVIKGY